VVPVTIDPNIFSSWHGKVAFVNPLNTCDELCQQVYKDTGIDATVRGDNVGYFSVITAVALNAQEVVMVGMPYSYDNEEAVMNLTGGDHVVKVRDVTKNYVYTTLDWLDARREFILFCRDIQAQFRITFTNCSEGGVLYQPQVIRACKLGVWIAHL
jgi:hypothetical protein